jgi:MFS family permease
VGGVAEKEKKARPGRKTRSKAIAFVLLIGIASLLADVATEGARSVTAPFLTTLGASAIAISLVAGLAELTGYGLRAIFGRITDRTGRYWTLTLIGFGINAIAVPLLALAGNWWIAASLIILEKTGRAIRGPARDAMISYSTTKVGRGWAFGVQEALSSVGGMIGPIIVIAVLTLEGSYQLGFELLAVPAILAIVVVLRARRMNPKPRDIEGKCVRADFRTTLPRAFWLYSLAGALIAAGYADFPLFAFHINSQYQSPQNMIPLLYAVAMGVDAISALLFGWLYDRVGMNSLIVATSIAAFFPLVGFMDGGGLVLLAMVLYGIGFGAQESVMRAIVADLAPICRRATAFGYYNAMFGVFWFAGSVTMGALYGISVTYMVAFSLAIQLMAIPFLVYVARTHEFKVRRK